MSLRASMNRLANTRNPFQSNRRKVLCVCSAGLLRSPTIAHVLSNEPYNCNTRACGYNEEYALVPLDPVLVAWADIIVCANEDHLAPVEELLPEGSTKKVYCLGIEDEYRAFDPRLIDSIKQALADNDFPSDEVIGVE